MAELDLSQYWWVLITIPLLALVIQRFVVGAQIKQGSMLRCSVCNAVSRPGGDTCPRCGAERPSSHPE